MTAEEARIINDLVTNQAYVLEIDAVTDLSDPLVRVDPEVETTYENETGMTFERDGKTYFIVFRDAAGGFLKPLDFNTLVDLKNKYGDKFCQYKDLPVVAEV